MADDVRVRVAGRAFATGGEVYTTGDELEVSEAVVKRHPNTLELIEGEGDESDGESESGDSEANTSTDYAREQLEEMEWSDLRTLATEYEGDEIDGRSSRIEIIEVLSNG